jgi:hypothetical protein
MLSHRWSDLTPLKLTPSNLNTLTAGIEIDKLSTTFLDAMVVTRRPGLKYLWIDSLCNVQDEPEFTDWKVEAPKIGDIYQNAELNVANARCGSPTEGLFATRTVTGDETMPSGRCLGKF